MLLPLAGKGADGSNGTMMRTFYYPFHSVSFIRLASGSDSLNGF